MNQNDTKIRVRFAPSPTGYMHIANFRTAIYNWIFAKQNNGLFFIRIEDTDMERSKKEYEDAIFNTFKTFNLPFDLYKGGIMRQSERLSLYEQIGNQLYENGYAFYCQCEKEEECSCKTQSHTQGVLRFKVPKNVELSFDDMIGGVCTRNTNDIENFALLRSNKIATYNFAVVVDDNEMEISHVIRGEDHRTNTFKQILIYNAMKWTCPVFGHLPLILGSDKQKLSKRNGDSSVQSLLDQGYVKEAILNMIMRVGWGYENEEIIPMDMALRVFNVKDVSRGPAVFDINKLKSLSAHYLRHGNYIKEICDKISSLTDKFYVTQVITEIYSELTSRCHTINECVEMSQFIFEDKKHMPSDTSTYDIIRNLNNKLKFEDWFASLRDLPNGKLVRKTIRQIVTGSEHGLPMEILYKYKIHNKQII